MPDQSNKTCAETSYEGLSASLPISVTTIISTPVNHTGASATIADSTASAISISVHHSETSSTLPDSVTSTEISTPVNHTGTPATIADSTASAISILVHRSEASSTLTDSVTSTVYSTLLPSTSVSVSPVSVQNSPYFAVPGPSGLQTGSSFDILQTALLLSGVGEEFLSDVAKPDDNPIREVPAHKLSLLQEDLYLSDSDEEAGDYELDLNSDISDDLINVTSQGIERQDSLSDCDDDNSDDDESVSDSESFSSDNEDSDSSDCSPDEEYDSDASTDDGNSSDDEAESSSDSDDEPGVKRRPLLRASDILVTSNTSFIHNFISLTLSEEKFGGAKRKRDDNSPRFNPKRIKLEDEMASVYLAGLEYGLRENHDESEPSTSTGITHKRKRRASNHKDPYKYPPSVPKRQRLVSNDDRLFPNLCPRTCPCITGCRVSSLRLRRIRRRYTVIQPLYKKLLNNRLLGPRNISCQRCCEKLCCFRWFGKALPQYALLDDYPQSDMGKQDFRMGPRKEGKGHTV